MTCDRGEFLLRKRPEQFIDIYKKLVNWETTTFLFPFIDLFREKRGD